MTQTYSPDILELVLTSCSDTAVVVRSNNSVVLSSELAICIVRRTLNPPSAVRTKPVQVFMKLYQLKFSVNITNSNLRDLTMSLEEEEYDGTDDEEESEYDYSEGHVSQMHFLSGKKRKIDFEEVIDVSTEPPPPFPQNYEAHNFRQLTQLDGKGHLSTSVATTSARVGFKCRSVLVKLREVYLILINVPHLKQRLKATNLMSVFDWITPRDFTVPTGIDYEKGCISFAHLRTYLDHTKVNIKDPANANTIFKAFMILYFGGVLFGNSKSWARLELLGPIAVIENKTYTIDFGPTILGHLYYCLDQASKQEYHCYEYCQIGHHILIVNRLDDFWPRMSAWTLDLEARHLHKESRITHLTTNLRRVEGRLSQLNDYLDGEGIAVDWEDGEGEAGTSQARTSRGRGLRERGSRGRTSEDGVAPPR
ncbi:hypothetical protein GIB67_032986 [Kingdonia uniflora]|uniref:Uncharacterized protein n=1 Tax=Kingdonia uniflora TaxID=39325 RepID=A0A7J7MYQ2_9MAGN|nr:hypothetical protein GIB67_032986 [Kingdonia uniflora]